MRRLILTVLCLSGFLVFSFAQDFETAKIAYQKGVQAQNEGRYDEAITLFEQMRQECPDILPPDSKFEKMCPIGVFNAGVCRMAQKDYDAAIVDFKYVIEINPSDHEAFAKISGCYASLGKHKFALENITRAYDLAYSQNALDQKKKKWYLHDLALSHRDNGNASEALKWLKNYLDEFNTDDAVRVEYIRILLDQGKYKRAKKEFSLFSDEAPEVNGYYYLKAVLAMREGRYGEAIPYLQAVEDENDIRASIRHFAECYIMTEDFDTALEYIEMMPDKGFSLSETARMEGLWGYMQADWDYAKEALDKAMYKLSHLDTLERVLLAERAEVFFRSGEFEDAINDCRKLTEKYGSFPDVISLEALANMELHQYDQAANLFVQAGSACGKSKFCEGRSAWLLFHMGATQQAYEKIKRVVDEYPDWAEGQYYYAEIAYQMSLDRNQVITALEFVTDRMPPMPEIFALRARVASEVGSVNEALNYLEQAEQIGIRHNRALLNASWVYSENRQFTPAVEKLDILRKKGYAGSDYQRLYAKVLFEQERYADVITTIEDYLRRNDADVNILEYYAFSLFEEEYKDEAERAVKHALAIQEGNVSLRVLLAKIYRESGKFNLAKEECKIAIGISESTFYEPFLVLGQIHSDLDLDEKAIGFFTQAEKLAQDAGLDHVLGEIYAGRGYAKAELGYEKDALIDYNKGIEVDPSEILLENRANLYWQLEEYGEAIRDFRSAIVMKEQNTGAGMYFNLGMVYMDDSQYVNASDAFGEAIEIEFSSNGIVPDEYFFQRGRALYESGDTERAIEQFEEIVANKEGLDWQAMYYYGKCKYRRGDYPGAVKAYDYLINDKKTEESLVFEARGDAFSMMEIFDKAAKDYDSAKEYSPKELCFYNKEGHAHLRDEAWTASVNAYNDYVIASQEYYPGQTIPASIYHGKARAFSGKMAQHESELAFNEAIKNYATALNLCEDPTERRFILKNMRNTYRRWDKETYQTDIQRIDGQLNGDVTIPPSVNVIECGATG